MTLQASGAISLGNICDEMDVYKEQSIHGSSARARHSDLADLCRDNIGIINISNGDFYGYTHPIVQIDSIVYVDQSFNRMTININLSIQGGQTYDKSITVTFLETWEFTADAFSTDTGTNPDSIDPDSVSAGTLGDPYPKIETTVVFSPGETSKTITREVVKIASNYTFEFQLKRTKGNYEHDKYKIGGTTIETYSVLAAPTLWTFATSTSVLNPCANAATMPNQMFLRNVGTNDGTPRQNDEMYTTNNWETAQPYPAGTYKVQRSGSSTEYAITIGSGGVISSTPTECTAGPIGP